MTYSTEDILSLFPGSEFLARGFYGLTFATSSTKVVKMLKEEDYEGGDLQTWETFEGDYVPSEVLALQWANTVNNLLVKFVSHIHQEELGHFIAMERLFPCLPTAFSREEIETALKLAEFQLQKLHESGFAHRDIRRPEHMAKNTVDDALYNNVMLTEVNGKCVIRLIDAGISILDQYDDFDELDDAILKDRQDWKQFKQWILNYPRG